MSGLLDQRRRSIMTKLKGLFKRNGATDQGAAMQPREISWPASGWTHLVIVEDVNQAVHPPPHLARALQWGRQDDVDTAPKVTLTSGVSGRPAAQ